MDDTPDPIRLLRPSRLSAAARAAYHRRSADELREKFKAGGKGQLAAFAELSRTVAGLVDRLKKERGPRSGAVRRAAGEFAKNLQRFMAVDGLPPDQLYKKLYKTPAAWIRLLEGFARELGADPDQLVEDALSRALHVRDRPASFARKSWLAALDELLDPMVDMLRRRVDFLEFAEFLAAQGVRVAGDAVVRTYEACVRARWMPMRSYGPEVLGAFPHVFGLGAAWYDGGGRPYGPKEDPPTEVPFSGEAKRRLVRHLVPEEASAIDPETVFVGFSWVERTGLAFAVPAGRDEPDLAFVKWRGPWLTLFHEHGRSLGAIHEDQLRDLGVKLPAGVASCPPEGWEKRHNGFSLGLEPEVWLAFRGTPEFDDIAASPVPDPDVDPDPEPPIVIETVELRSFEPRSGSTMALVGDSGEPGDGADALPPDCDRIPQPADDGDEEVDRLLACPPETFAGRIERNLLLELGAFDGEWTDYPREERFDRLLASRLDRMVALVERWYREHEAERERLRERLLGEWRSPGATESGQP